MEHLITPSTVSASEDKDRVFAVRFEMLKEKDYRNPVGYDAVVAVSV
jgi:hypothetical protein